MLLWKLRIFLQIFVLFNVEISNLFPVSMGALKPFDTQKQKLLRVRCNKGKELQK